MLRQIGDLLRVNHVVAPLEICMETSEPEYPSEATYITQSKRIGPFKKVKIGDSFGLTKIDTTVKALPKPVLLQCPLEIIFEICRYVCDPLFRPQVLS